MDADATQILDNLNESDVDLTGDECYYERKPCAVLHVPSQKGFGGGEYDLYPGANTIGRAPRCGVYIPVQGMSKQHACIEIKPALDVDLVYDLKSQNGTKRGKMRLEPEVRYELRHGDELTFADLQCRYTRAPEYAQGKSSSSALSSQVKLEGRAVDHEVSAEDDDCSSTDKSVDMLQMAEDVLVTPDGSPRGKISDAFVVPQSIVGGCRARIERAVASTNDSADDDPEAHHLNPTTLRWQQSTPIRDADVNEDIFNVATQAYTMPADDFVNETNNTVEETCDQDNSNAMQAQVGTQIRDTTSDRDSDAADFSAVAIPRPESCRNTAVSNSFSNSTDKHASQNADTDSAYDAETLPCSTASLAKPQTAVTVSKPEDAAITFVPPGGCVLKVDTDIGAAADSDNDSTLLISDVEDNEMQHVSSSDQQGHSSANSALLLQPKGRLQPHFVPQAEQPVSEQEHTMPAITTEDQEIGEPGSLRDGFSLRSDTNLISADDGIQQESVTQPGATTGNQKRNRIPLPSASSKHGRSDPAVNLMPANGDYVPSSSLEANSEDESNLQKYDESNKRPGKFGYVPISQTLTANSDTLPYYDDSSDEAEKKDCPAGPSSAEHRTSTEVSDSSNAASVKLLQPARKGNKTRRHHVKPAVSSSSSLSDGMPGTSVQQLHLKSTGYITEDLQRNEVTVSPTAAGPRRGVRHRATAVTVSPSRDLSPEPHAEQHVKSASRKSCPGNRQQFRIGDETIADRSDDYLNLSIEPSTAQSTGGKVQSKGKSKGRNLNAKQKAVADTAESTRGSKRRRVSCPVDVATVSPCLAEAVSEAANAVPAVSDGDGPVGTVAAAMGKCLSEDRHSQTAVANVTPACQEVKVAVMSRRHDRSCSREHLASTMPDKLPEDTASANLPRPVATTACAVGPRTEESPAVAVGRKGARGLRFWEAPSEVTCNVSGPTTVVRPASIMADSGDPAVNKSISRPRGSKQSSQRSQGLGKKETTDYKNVQTRRSAIEPPDSFIDDKRQPPESVQSPLSSAKRLPNTRVRKSPMVAMCDATAQEGAEGEDRPSVIQDMSAATRGGVKQSKASKKRKSALLKEETPPAGPQSKLTKILEKSGNKIQPNPSPVTSEQHCTSALRITKPKIMFTGISESEYHEVIKRLGGTLVDSVSQCTHLVTDEVRRTLKFLCCVARGIPIVTPQWLAESDSAASFLDVSAFLLRDKAKEKLYNFTLPQSLERARTSPMLKDYRVHATKSVKPPPEQIKDIVTVAGGTYLKTMPKPGSLTTSTVIISCSEDLTTCRAAAAASNASVVTAEFLLTGILQQKVNVKAYALEL